jgi:uncharacterized iron-regulated membrane protein
MSTSRTMRKIHYWLSPILLVSVFVIATTGVLLALKKDFAFLQPVGRNGINSGLSDRTISSLLTSAKMVPGHDALGWRDIDRIDIRPRDGIAKVILESRTEIQVDLTTGIAVETGYRTSDMLESIHDFSFIGDWAKYVFSFGSGIALIFMGVTGVYLFVLPTLVRRRKRIEKVRHSRASKNRNVV